MVEFKDNLTLLKVNSILAGHMLGGTAWKITKDDEEEYVYAVDINHKREMHLNGFEVDRIQKPNLLITDGLNINYSQERKTKRTEKFIQRIVQTTSNGGNVLITTDTAGRVLELVMLLEVRVTIIFKTYLGSILTQVISFLLGFSLNHILTLIEGLWSDERTGVSHVNLVMVSNVSSSTRDCAKGMIEWMSDKVIQPFMKQRINPYEFKAWMKMFHDLDPTIM